MCLPFPDNVHYLSFSTYIQCYMHSANTHGARNARCKERMRGGRSLTRRPMEVTTITVATHFR